MSDFPCINDGDDYDLCDCRKCLIKRSEQQELKIQQLQVLLDHEQWRYERASEKLKLLESKLPILPTYVVVHILDDGPDGFIYRPTLCWDYDTAVMQAHLDDPRYIATGHIFKLEETI